MIIFYKKFNFGLAPQTFGLVTSSNSLPKGQPYFFIFVSPYCFVRLITIIANEKYFWKHCYKSILINMQIELHVYCLTGSTLLKI